MSQTSPEELVRQYGQAKPAEVAQVILELGRAQGREALTIELATGSLDFERLTVAVES